jgi:galactose-1-phosphate uridylyltransferase
MKLTTTISQEKREIPSAWLDAEYAALRSDQADSCDDRISQNMFDAEDEREEIDVIVHGMDHEIN